MGWESLMWAVAVDGHRRDAATTRQQLREYRRYDSPPPLPPSTPRRPARRWLLTLAIVGFVLLTGLQIAAARLG